MPNYNPEIEEALISSVLNDTALFPILKDIISSNDLFWYPHKWVWTSFINLFDAGKHIDMLTLVDDMERSGSLENYVSAIGNIKGLEALNKLKDINPDTTHAETYARQVKDDSSRRKILEILNKGEKWVLDGNPSIEILTNVEQELGKIAAYAGAKSNALLSASDAVKAANDATIQASRGNGTEVKSGLIDLDDIIGGLFPGDLSIISARAGEGKTALMLTIAANATINAKRKKSVGIFSMEMSTPDIINRLISQYTGISATKMRRGDLKESDWDIYNEASEKISKANIHFDDTPSLTIPELRTKIRKMKELGVDLVIIDQLNLMNAQMINAKEFEKINWLSYRLKELAREFDLHVMVAHQMNRGIEQQSSGQKSPKRDPQLSDLEQAGEKATDIVIMIRHKKEQNVIKDSFLHVVKHRNGATGIAPVLFIGNRVKFENVDKNTIMPEWVQDKEENKNEQV